MLFFFNTVLYLASIRCSEVQVRSGFEPFQDYHQAQQDALSGYLKHKVDPVNKQKLISKPEKQKQASFLE